LRKTYESQQDAGEAAEQGQQDGWQEGGQGWHVQPGKLAVPFATPGAGSDPGSASSSASALGYQASASGFGMIKHPWGVKVSRQLFGTQDAPHSIIHPFLAMAPAPRPRLQRPEHGHVLPRRARMRSTPAFTTVSTCQAHRTRCLSSD